MKLFTLALAASAVALASSSLRADTRFSIGVHVGPPSYRTAPPVVTYAPPPPVVYAPPPTVIYAPTRGYWSDVVVKTWVPERWTVSRDRWGRMVRHYEPGYFTYRTERIWIDGRDNCHPNRHNEALSYSPWGHR